MLYPFFVIFGDSNNQEIASSIILANSKEVAEAVAFDVIEEVGMSDCVTVLAVPFTLELVNSYIKKSGVLLFNYREENEPEDMGFFTEGGIR